MITEYCTYHSHYLKIWPEDHDDTQVFISIENYGEDIIREFNGHIDQQDYFVFSWEISKKFDGIETLLAFVDVTDGVS